MLVGDVLLCLLYNLLTAKKAPVFQGLVDGTVISSHPQPRMSGLHIPAEADTEPLGPGTV